MKCARSGCFQTGMITSSAKSKYGDVLTSSGMSPRGGGIVFHDAGDGGVSDDFKLFVMSNRTNEIRGCLEYEEVGANFYESGEFVYVCGSELWYGGENGESGLRVEPMCGEECLECVSTVVLAWKLIVGS